MREQLKKWVRPALLVALGVLAAGMILEGNVGPQIVGDGTTARQRFGREAQTITGDLSGKYYESASRGTLFTVSTATAGTTQVAANQSPLAANTGQPLVGVYNPLGSNVNLEVVSITINQISGTPTAGGFMYNVAFGQAITATGTAPQSNSSLVKSKAVGFVNQATTGSTLALVLRPAPGCTSFAGALAATTLGLSCFDFLDGTVVVPPGGLFGVATVGAAGTSWVVGAGLVYREAPIAGQ